MPRFWQQSSLFLLLMLVSLRPAFALSVDSMVKIIPADSSRATFVLESADKSSQIEAECFNVTIDMYGQEQLQECDESQVLLYPYIFELPANSKRSVRVTRLSSDNDNETSFRIFFRELPSRHVSGVQLLSRLGCWLFFRPTIEQVTVSAQLQQNKLMIINDSNIHLRPVEGKITTKDATFNISDSLKRMPRILTHSKRFIPLDKSILTHLNNRKKIETLHLTLESGVHLSIPIL